MSFTGGLGLGLATRRGFDPAGDGPVGFVNNCSITGDGSAAFIDQGRDADLAFERTDPFSISWWAKALGAQDTQFSKMDGVADKGYRCHVNDAASQVQVFCHDGTTQLRAQKARPADGLWHHYVMVYDGDSAGLNIWIDAVAGTQDQFGPLTATMVNHDEPFTWMEKNGKQFMAGLHDEVTIWDKALSSGEISELYNAGKPDRILDHSAVANCIRWYRHGEQTGVPLIMDAVGKVSPSIAFKTYRLLCLDSGGGLNKRLHTWRAWFGATEIFPTNMTAQSTPSPFVARASIDDLNAWEAFDGNDNTRWDVGSDPQNQWISITLGSAQKISEIRVRSWGGGRGIGSYRIQGTNDADPFTASWTTIQDFFDNVGDQFDVTNPLRPYAIMKNMDATNIKMDVP